MAKGYKVFKKDYSCRDCSFLKDGEFEGTEHTIEGILAICCNGFHFCEKLTDCFNYYSFDSENKVAEIEVLGELVTDDDKSVTNKIKIVKELTWFEVLELVNIGKNNTGKKNSGNENSGDGNSGNRNSGSWNSGNDNSGNDNSGNENSGDGNSGNRNSGSWNSGYRNSGDGNSGSWNSCNNETGFFNSVNPKTINVFNKPCNVEDWENVEKPNFIYFDLIHIEDGKLKTKKYKEAFKEAWEKASKEDRIKIKNLPNFDKDIFFEISGIDVDKEEK